MHFIDNLPRSVGSVHPPFPISGEPSLRAAALNNDFVFVYSLCFIALPVRASFLPADWFSDGLRAVWRSVFESAENHTGTHSAAVCAMPDSEAETPKSPQVTTGCRQKAD